MEHSAVDRFGHARLRDAHASRQQRSSCALALLAGGPVVDHRQRALHRRSHRNRWWENVVMAVLFVLAIYGAIGSVRSIAEFVQ